MFAREETIAKDPDGLRAFLRATVKGMKYAFAPEHLEEGARAVVKANPEVDLDAAVGASSVASRYAFTEEVTSGKVAIGQFEPARVERSRDIYSEFFQLKRKVTTDEIVTNDLLPEKK
jgi:NitT/TauT family transport system substrate-binding protein